MEGVDRHRDIEALIHCSILEFDRRVRHVAQRLQAHRADGDMGESGCIRSLSVLTNTIQKNT